MNTKIATSEVTGIKINKKAFHFQKGFFVNLAFFVGAIQFL